MKDSLIVIGLQYGDEGKGRIVDYLGSKFDGVVRYNGANNAGHTIVLNSLKFPLSQLPCSVFNNNDLLIAQGCSINPEVLINEIKSLESLNIQVKLTIDYRCHIIMPYHQILDELTEKHKTNKMGSLKLGVGYSYEDKTNREGIRLEDLLDISILKEKLTRNIAIKNDRIEKVFGTHSDLSLDSILSEFHKYGKYLEQYIGDVSEIILDGLDNKKYLFESAQSYNLDYAFGTYPYTVAYHTLASSVLTGVGLPPTDIDVLGIIRAYSIRVGNGPFPTEDTTSLGEQLRIIGNEYGTVSKRPRRCGWLDLPVIKKGLKINGVSRLALTKLDVLSHFKEIPVCTSYNQIDSNIVEPNYKKCEGWNEDISGIRDLNKLPTNCRKYISLVEEQLGVPITLISVGAERESIIEV